MYQKDTYLMCVKRLYTLDPSPTFLETYGASKYAVEEDSE